MTFCTSESVRSCPPTMLTSTLAACPSSEPRSISGFCNAWASASRRPRRRGLAVTEQAARIVATQGAEQIVETEVDQAAPVHEIDDRPHALADDVVRAGKCLVDPGFGQDQFAHPVVLEAHHRVGVLLDGAQRLLRLLRAPPALEGKRQRRAHEHQRILLARRFDDHRRRARAGAAAQPGADDDQRHASTAARISSTASSAAE